MDSGNRLVRCKSGEDREPEADSSRALYTGQRSRSGAQEEFLCLRGIEPEQRHEKHRVSVALRLQDSGFCRARHEQYGWRDFRRSGRRWRRTQETRVPQGLQVLHGLRKQFLAWLYYREVSTRKGGRMYPYLLGRSRHRARFLHGRRH